MSLLALPGGCADWIPMDHATSYLTQVLGIYGHYAMTFVYASVSAAALEEAIPIAEGELTLWIQKSLINFPARL